MNKKFWIAVVVIFVVAMGLGFLIHGTLLKADYQALASLYRSEAEQMQHFPFMLAAHLSMAIGLVWVYARGHEHKPVLAQGLRFGLAITVLFTIPMYLIYYSVQPLPQMLVIKQIGFDTVGNLLIGVVLAWLYR